MIAVRSGLFYVVYVLAATWFGATAPLIAWLPFRYRFRYVRGWNHVVLAALRIICGIRTRVHGLDNIPDRPCVVMCKHQSQWETYYLQVVFTPLCTILKQELLSIPIFGWGLRQMSPIAIDRTAPRDALRKVQQQGLQRLTNGASVLVFPEGTRVAPGEHRRYARSGASLAISASAPILPIAHNGGLFWPADGYKKFPGVVDVVIGAPIDPLSGDARALTERVEEWIETESNRLLAAARETAAKPKEGV